VDDRIYFGGTETSIEFPGYMEGAISVAVRLAKMIVSS
jgi:monoamine oxidase